MLLLVVGVGKGGGRGSQDKSQDFEKSGAKIEMFFSKYCS
jgi:hypothetical protein